MNRLDTIQQIGIMNDIYPADEIGAGNAYHKYEIKDANGGNFSFLLQMQHGRRTDYNPTNGLLLVDLLEIARNQLQGFQTGEFANENNAEALNHIEQALMFLNKRSTDRANRGVLGTYNK
jgi:hypothetical protein